MFSLGGCHVYIHYIQLNWFWSRIVASLLARDPREVVDLYILHVVHEVFVYARFRVLFIYLHI